MVDQDSECSEPEGPEPVEQELLVYMQPPIERGDVSTDKDSGIKKFKI
jgi:hypothetical protein